MPNWIDMLLPPEATIHQALAASLPLGTRRTGIRHKALEARLEQGEG
jgi:hypothetical protein